MGEAAADILVVDDTPANVRLLQTILEARGYEVRSASSGAEALAAVAERRPDLVLLDVVMPGMDGLEACRRLRADPATAALPVLMVTASDHSDKVTALDAGADDFVTKPFDQAELLARMRSLLRIKAYQATIEAQAATLASLNQDLEARIRHQVEELERLNLLRRFLPPQLADAIVASGDDSVLEDHRAEIAVLYTGLRGFTRVSETAAPEEVIGVLREFHEAVGALAHRNDATVGFFSYNGLMAFLNDPIPVDAPAWQAVVLATEMRELVDGLSRGWRRRDHDLHFAAGIAVGYATIGRMGFEGRWDYKPTGLVVSLAARLFEEARPGQILISRRTHAAVEGKVDATRIPDLDLDGFRDPMEAYALEAVLVRPEAVGREGLTSREIEVLALVVEGSSNRGIAERLVISEKTAIRHVSNIFVKLGVHNRAEATRAALERGLLPQDGDGE
jgi:adenylate cyclase